MSGFHTWEAPCLCHAFQILRIGINLGHRVTAPGAEHCASSIDHTSQFPQQVRWPSFFFLGNENTLGAQTRVSDAQ